MLRRLSAISAILALALAGCAEPPVRMAANDDAYQACVHRGYQIGDLPYRATTFYHSNAADHIWPATKSPVEQCSEFRARGQL